MTAPRELVVETRRGDHHRIAAGEDVFDPDGNAMDLDQLMEFVARRPAGWFDVLTEARVEVAPTEEWMEPSHGDWHPATRRILVREVTGLLMVYELDEDDGNE